MNLPRWLKRLLGLAGPEAAALSRRRVALPGSEFVPLAGARRKWIPRPDERIQVTVVLKPRRAVPDRSGPQFAATSPAARAPISRKEFARKHSADAESVAKVVEFARRHGLEVINRSGLRRRVLLAGSRSSMAEAFGVKFVHYKHAAGEHRGFRGAVEIPEELNDVVEAVLGLNDEPLAQPRFALDHHRGSAKTSLSATELARLYGFPAADGAGQCIGIIALAGGFSRRDIEAFFEDEGLPVPRITEVHVDDGFDKAKQGRNRPASAAELDALAEYLAGNKAEVTAEAWHTLETTMDVELLGAFAPGARLVVYFAPSNTADGLYNTLMCIVNDTVNDPAVVSMSWGWPEHQHLAESKLDDPYVGEPVSAPLLIANSTLRSFVELGVTMCVASGDDLARDARDRPGVQFPGSSPHVLACGGTTIEVAHGDRIASEKVWKDGDYASCGGVSRIFERPYWQLGLEIPRAPGCCHRAGRGVPDVAAAADRGNGCRIVVGGHRLTSAGTSAVAPFWAALIARIYHETGMERDYLTPCLYRIALKDRSAFRPIQDSDNGFYYAAEGPAWNACTGLGGPVGARLVAALRELRQPEPRREIRPPAAGRRPGPEVSPP